MRDKNKFLLYIVTLFFSVLTLTIPVEANTKLQNRMKLLEKLDMLDAIDFQDAINAANNCTSRRNFDCSRDKISRAKKLASTKAQKQNLSYAQLALKEEIDFVREEEELERQRIAEERRIREEERRERERLQAEAKRRAAAEKKRVERQQTYDNMKWYFNEVNKNLKQGVAKHKQSRQRVANRWAKIERDNKQLYAKRHREANRIHEQKQRALQKRKRQQQERRRSQQRRIASNNAYASQAKQRRAEREAKQRKQRKYEKKLAEQARLKQMRADFSRKNPNYTNKTKSASQSTGARNALSASSTNLTRSSAATSSKREKHGKQVSIMNYGSGTHKSFISNAWDAATYGVYSKAKDEIERSCKAAGFDYVYEPSLVIHQGKCKKLNPTSETSWSCTGNGRAQCYKHGYPSEVPGSKPENYFNIPKSNYRTSFSKIY